MKTNFTWMLCSIIIFNITPILSQSTNNNNPKSKIYGLEKKTHSASLGKNKITSNNVMRLGKKLEKHLGVTQSLKKTNNHSALNSFISDENRTLIDLNRSNQSKKVSEFNIRWSKYNSTPTSFSNINTLLKVEKSNSKTSAYENAISFISSKKEIFKLDNPNEELILTEEKVDDFNMKHLVFEQEYKGIPIWGQEMVVHSDSKGEIYSINARYSETPLGIDINENSISSEKALSIAENNLSKISKLTDLSDYYKNILDYKKPYIKKYIWLDDKQTKHLVWFVQIRPNIMDNWYYFIKIKTGEILEKYNATAFDGPVTATAVDLLGVNRTLNVYESTGNFFMLDASRNMWQQNQTDVINDPKGAIQTLDAQNQDLSSTSQIFHVASTNNSWGDPVTVSAHYNGGITYEYFLNTHGRNAIDNMGSTIISIVHVTSEGQPMDNAYWNSKIMAYGDGDQSFNPLAGALDVTGHEMTHGVIERTVGLEYKFQSGALNESLADVFGAMIDREDWLMGEDIVKPGVFASGAMRNLLDPHNGGTSINDNGWQPAHMDEFLNLTLDQDNGGVHVNSGIPNRACALIGEAIGKEKTEKIYYRVMDARYLNSQSQFIDMRLGVIQAATDLYGENSTELTAVKDAFDTVGILDGSGTEREDDLPPVEGEQWIASINAEGTDNSLYLVRPTIQQESDIKLLTSTQVYTLTGNPISVSDDGSVILFIDSDNFIRVINSDGSQETVISESGDWNSISISPDGSKLAATSIYSEAYIYIFDFINSENSKVIALYNPTTQDGIQDSSVRYADALDWDLNSETIIYDCFNEIPGNDGSNIEYWTVNVLDLVNEKIFALFPPQEDGINIGNPSFGQTNSNYLLIDLIDVNNSTVDIVAIDLFSGTSNVIETNGSSISFPRYSSLDDRVVFQRYDDLGIADLRQIGLNEDKITASSSSFDFVTGGQLPSWFSIGARPVSIEDEQTQIIPDEFVLKQNYPNPFNPTTVINYSIPDLGARHDSPVQLKVYDVLGNEVATLVNQPQNSGNYKVSFDASSLSSGIYFYRLQTDNFNQSKKMLLLK